jgi:glycosyltransferase involved in cell wall biosynthesis
MAHDLIVFGEDWGAHPSSTQHLIRAMIPDRRVIWVNSLGLRAPRLTRKDGARLVRKLGSLVSATLGLNAPEATLEGRQPDIIISPAAIPLPGNRTAAALTLTMVARQVRHAMKRLGMRRPVVWSSLPTSEPLAGAFEERALVFYAGDDFSALDGVDHDPVMALERRLANKAQLVLAASPEIAQRFPEGKTMIVPHGVDIDLFAKPQPRPADLPEGKPIVGFYGSLSGWIDIELLIKTARTMPGTNFVFIGPINTDIQSLDVMPNVFMLGPKPHHLLPGYVQHFKVAMLPFRDTPQIRACNPLKLREYMASGVAIAATDFPALDPYRSLIHVGTSPASFIEAIRTALADGNRRSLRQRAVANETWHRRAEDLAAVIDLL